MSITSESEVVKGGLQGGMLLPLLWNVVLDTLINHLHDNDLYLNDKMADELKRESQSLYGECTMGQIWPKCCGKSNPTHPSRLELYKLRKKGLFRLYRLISTVFIKNVWSNLWNQLYRVSFLQHYNSLFSTIISLSTPYLICTIWSVNRITSLHQKMTLAF